MIDLFVDNRQKDLTIKEEEIKLIENLFSFALSYMKEEDRVELSLSFVDDDEIQSLNKSFRGVDRVTDVLSFPLFTSFGGLKQLGDIVINTKQLKRQAEEFGHTYRRELTYLSLHSLLHLYGYDHEMEDEKRIMRDLEEKILKSFEGD